jgi:hypothetical protein
VTRRSSTLARMEGVSPSGSFSDAAFMTWRPTWDTGLRATARRHGRRPGETAGSQGARQAVGAAGSHDLTPRCPASATSTASA